MTGSGPDGRLRREVDPNTGLPDGAPLTCNDWTSRAEGPYRTWVGHTDYEGPDQSWNSAHDTLGCTADQLLEYIGNGGLYCFAID